MTTFNAGAIEANLSLGRSSWVRDLKKTQKEIADLEKKGITIGIDADTDNAQIAMDNIELMLDDLDQKTYTPTVDLLIHEAEDALANLEARLDALGARTVTVTADADIAHAVEALDAIHNYADALDGYDVDMDVDANIVPATAAFDAILAYANGLDGMNVNIDVDAETAAAQAHLGQIAAMAKLLDSEDINIDVNYDKSMLNSLVGSPDGDSKGGGHLGLLRILLIAVIALFPIVAAASGAATAGLVAFLGAIVAAAGPVLVLALGVFALIQRFNELTEAGGKLPAPLQHLQNALDDLTKAWGTFTDKIDNKAFNVAAQGVELLAYVLPLLAPLFNATADMIGNVLDEISTFVHSPDFKAMLDWFSTSGVQMLESFIHILGNLLVFFGKLFGAMQPFTDAMMQGIEDITAGWAAWADQLGSDKSFQEWLDNAAKYGPMVLDLLGSIIGAFINLGRAVEPFAGPMFEILTNFFDMIANADPDQLRILVSVLAALWVAVNFGIPLVGALSTGIDVLIATIGFLLSPIGLVVLAIVGLIAMFVYLWETNDKFRKFMIDAWENIQKTVAPIIEDISKIIKENWGPLKDWIMDTWGDVQDFFIQFFELVAVMFEIGARTIGWIWKHFGDDLVTIVKGFVTTIGAWIKGLLQILTGIFMVIRGVLTGDWGLIWDGLRKIFKGFVTFISGSIRGALGIWRGLFGIIGSALNAVFGGMVRGIKDKWNELRSWISDKIRGLGNWIKGIKFDPGAMFDGIKNAFKNAINHIIDWWNNLSFKIPGFDPPGPGPKIPGFGISTPNLGHLATGGYITDRGVYEVGEGPDPEIVAPEPMLKKIVAENSGGAIDYGRLAAAVAAALSAVLDRLPGVTEEQLERLIEAAAIQVTIDARGDTGASVTKLAQAIGFELRVLGFGGRAAA